MSNEVAETAPQAVSMPDLRGYWIHGQDSSVRAEDVQSLFIQEWIGGYMTRAVTHKGSLIFLETTNKAEADAALELLRNRLGCGPLDETERRTGLRAGFCSAHPSAS